ncbi:hypothetical protein DSECCO2_432060 [anaerobic digester metagenome]
MVWTVRRRLLDTVVERWNITNPVIVDVGTASVMAAADAVMDAVWEWREAQAFSPVPAPPVPGDRIAAPPQCADAAAGAPRSTPVILRRCYGPDE